MLLVIKREEMLVLRLFPMRPHLVCPQPQPVCSLKPMWRKGKGLLHPGLLGQQRCQCQLHWPNQCSSTLKSSAGCIAPLLALTLPPRSSHHTWAPSSSLAHS